METANFMAKNLSGDIVPQQAILVGDTEQGQLIPQYSSPNINFVSITLLGPNSTYNFSQCGSLPGYEIPVYNDQFSTSNLGVFYLAYGYTLPMFVDGGPYPAPNVGGSGFLGPLTVNFEIAYIPSSISYSNLQSCQGSVCGTNVKVSWSNGNQYGTNQSDISYELVRGTINSSGAVQWSSIYEGGGTSFTTTDQTCGVGYIYEVSPYGQYGPPAPNSQSAPWTTSPEFDEFPCSVSVSSTSSNSITVTWPEVTPNTHAVIVWCETATQAGSVSCQQTSSGSLPAGTTSYTITNLQPAAQYTIWACSSTDMWGCPSTTANTATDVFPPTNVSLSQVSNTAAVASWSAGQNGQSNEYEASLYTCGNTSSPLQQSGWTTGLSWTVAGLSPNTCYVVGVQAKDPYGNVSNTAWSNQLTISSPPNTPGTPQISNVTQNSLTASWSTNGNQSGTSYYAAIYTCSNTTSPVAVSGWMQNATSYTFTGLSPSTCYVVGVMAENSAGQQSSWAYSAQVTTLADVGAPQNPSISAPAYDQVTVSWSPGTNDYEYEVTVYTCGSLSAAASSGWITQTSWTWTGASASTCYTASIVAQDTSGNQSPAAGTGQVTTPAQPEVVPTPTVTISNVGSTSLTVNWSNGYYSYFYNANLYTCGNTTTPYEEFWNTYNESYTFTNLSPNTCYVAAVDAEDPSTGATSSWGWSSQVTTEPIVGAPSSASISAPAYNKIAVSWSSGYNDSFYIVNVYPCGSTSSPVAQSLWTNATSWTWDYAQGNTCYQASVTAQDSSGDVSQPTWTGQVTTPYPPIGVTLTLDGGTQTTYSGDITVATAISPVRSGVTYEARYSTNGGATWSAWQNEGYATSWSAQVTASVGSSPQTITVEEQVQDSAGDSGSATATISYQPPVQTQGSGLSGAVGIAGGTPIVGPSLPCSWPVAGQMVAATCVTQPQVILSLSPPSGATYMRASLDGTVWGAWVPAASKLALNLGSSPGLKTVWVQYEVNGGIVPDPSVNPAYFIVDPGPPTLQASWTGDASSTNSSGQASLEVQATDPVGTTGLRLTVTENGSTLYSGPLQSTVPLTLTGSGYQLVHVTVTDISGNTAQETLGIFVQ